MKPINEPKPTGPSFSVGRKFILSLNSTMDGGSYATTVACELCDCEGAGGYLPLNADWAYWEATGEDSPKKCKHVEDGIPNSAFTKK